MEHPFVRAMDHVYTACIWLAGAAVVMMSMIIPIGVFMRYVVGVGAQWPEPIAILFMVMFTFIGAAASYRAGAHIVVSLLTDALPPALRRACEIASDLLMAALCAFVAWHGFRLCALTWHQSISELPWLPVGVTYSPLPIGAAVTLLFIVERMIFGVQSHREAVRREERLVEQHAPASAHTPSAQERAA